MKHIIDRSFSLLYSSLTAVAATLLVVVVGVMLAQVGFRYLLSSPFSWAEEVARFSMIGITFLGLAVAWGRGQHITITALTGSLSGKVKVLAQILVNLAVLTVALALFWFGASVAETGLDAPSVAMQLPQGYVYAVVPLSAAIIALQCLRFLATNVSDIRQGGSL